MSSSPFDSLAPDYDAAFTDTRLGRLLRDAVQERLSHCFQPGQRLLEVGGGTGEDALYLARHGCQVVTTDPSAGMVATARAKVAAAGLANRVTVRRLAIEQVDSRLGRFDGLISNFGALNCVADLREAAGGLARCLRPGAHGVLVIMGRCVPWEWAWYGARGEWASAVRRLRPGGVRWRGLRIRYPSVGQAARAIAPWFRLRRVSAVGALLPPTFAIDWIEQHSALAAQLATLERRWEATWPLPSLADHFVLEVTR